MEEGIIYGRNSVIELLNSGKTINKLMILKGETHGSIKKIITLAREKKIIVSEVSRAKLDELTDGENHQGVIAYTIPYSYCDVDDILKVASERGEKPFVVILDGIEDPHNLGAIIRTAECMGAHGIIIPKRRAAAVTGTVIKVSAGALEHISVARVNNINDTILYLQEKGLWIVGMDAKGENSIQNIDLKGSTGIVIGSEGEGISNLTMKRCDLLARIDMKGKITSLNASVSCGMVLYEVLRQRLL